MCNQYITQNGRNPLSFGRKWEFYLEKIERLMLKKNWTMTANKLALLLLNFSKSPELNELLLPLSSVSFLFYHVCLSTRKLVSNNDYTVCVCLQYAAMIFMHGNVLGSSNLLLNFLWTRYPLICAFWKKNIFLLFSYVLRNIHEIDEKTINEVFSQKKKKNQWSLLEGTW